MSGTSLMAYPGPAPWFSRAGPPSQRIDGYSRGRAERR